MLIAQRSPEFKEKQWIEHFLMYAIQGEQAYIDIVKPMLIEAAKYANGEITIYKLNRKFFHFVLWLEKFENVKYICEANLMLKEVLQFLEQLEID